DAESRPAFGPVLRGDGSAGGLENGARDGQAQAAVRAGPAVLRALRVGGVAGFEDPLERFGGDAGAVVLDGDRDRGRVAVAAGDFAERDLNAARAVHGLGGVLDEVDQDAGQVFAAEA